MIPLRIRIERGHEITVCLREGEATFERDGEAILDVNREGKWIRGLELLGSVDFNLARAVRPFHPKPPLSGVAGSVTYDEEANAAFFSFSMKKPDTSRPESTRVKYSHSLTPEARFGFDDQGGLLWFRFLLPNEIRSAADFVALIDAPLG
jgi:hypothetical protein